jgi:hypothetical protein
MENLTDEELNRVITARDAMAHKFCARGQRRLWNANQDLVCDVTFEDFVKRGVTVRWLLATGNPYAETLVKLVLGKE